MWYVLPVGSFLLFAMLYIMVRAARRFEARERQLGRWDQ